MKIGVPKEIKNRENRVALTPVGAATLVAAGHEVTIQKGAGLGSGFADGEYRQAGVRVASVEDAWDAELVLKVKEPLKPEYPFLRGQILFTYFHLAGAERSLTEVLLESGVTAIAYETVEDEHGKLPLLTPMSAVAGNMALTMGGYYLAKFNGGKGMLLGIVQGRSYGKVLIIGDGVVGRHAAKVATGMGAQTWICGRHEDRLPELRQATSEDLQFILSTQENIREHLTDADLVIGAVLQRGARAPYVVDEAMVRGMQPGSVIVDVSIDQGGCVETSRPTSHSDPVFEKHGVIHYCVTNMPGAYPRTSTMVLTSATLPYIQRLCEDGVEALRQDSSFAKGVNTYQGWITCEPVAESLGLGERYKRFAEIAD